jgi:hypothetical protein
MRFIVLIFLAVLFFAACVKPTSTNPVPRLEYKEAINFGLTKTGNDTVDVVIGYEDGDGNLFVDNNSQGPNLIFSTRYYNADSAKFVLDKNFSNKVKQPDNGYYKGKAIKGEILLPMTEFRSSQSRKIVKFDIFMIDLSGNKTNVVTSPAYTLTF